MRSFFLIVLVCTVTCLSCGCSKKEAGEKEQDKTGGEQVVSPESADTAWVARVNGRVITASELTEEEGIVRGQLSGRISPAQLDSMTVDVKRQALDNLISRALFSEVVKREKIKVPQEKIETRMKTVQSRYESEEEFKQKLASEGMTEEKLRSNIEMGLGFEMLVDRLFSGVKASEDEITGYYNENVSSYKEPERVRASHILVKTEQGETEDIRAEKRRKIEEILGEIQQGADFAEMARTHSECGSSSRGGDLGFFPRGTMVPAFEEAAFSLRPGEMSGIVETNFGFHIIKVFDHTEARTVPLDEMRERISKYLDGKKKQEALNAYVGELRSAASIVYADSSLRQ